jgi:hypothetical protein
LEDFKSHQGVMAKDENVQPQLHKNKPAAGLKKR